MQRLLARVILCPRPEREQSLLGSSGPLKSTDEQRHCQGENLGRGLPILFLLLTGILPLADGGSPGSFQVVYSKTTGRVRSYVVPQFANESVTAQTGAGEAVLTFPMAQYGNLPAIQKLVAIATGLTPSNDRYAIVNAQGMVVGAIYADPVGCGDSLAGNQKFAGDSLVASQIAGPGWTFMLGMFMPPPFVKTKVFANQAVATPSVQPVTPH